VEHPLPAAAAAVLRALLETTALPAAPAAVAHIAIPQQAAAEPADKVALAATIHLQPALALAAAALLR
jgi:hypothetical protein